MLSAQSVPRVLITGLPPKFVLGTNFSDLRTNQAQCIERVKLTGNSQTPRNQAHVTIAEI